MASGMCPMREARRFLGDARACCGERSFSWLPLLVTTHPCSLVHRQLAHSPDGTCVNVPHHTALRRPGFSITLLLLWSMLSFDPTQVNRGKRLGAKVNCHEWAQSTASVSYCR